MSELILGDSVARASKRLRTSERRPRSDRGHSRLSPRVEAELLRILERTDRPPIVEAHRKLRSFCRRARLEVPSRGTLYNALARVPAPAYEFGELPPEVRQTLHNVAHGKIPGPPGVFAAFTYGEARALGLPAGRP